MPLSFLAPLFLAGAAAAVIPVVLHLLKREPEPRVKFSAVKLLKRAPVEHTEKRHLREFLLLALRMAALLLLAAAFARPFFTAGGAAVSSGVTIVALDTSYSMSAPGRFERARALAQDAIDRVPAGELVGVVTFADSADGVAEPSVDRVLAKAAVDQASAGLGATKYRAGLSAASQMMKGARGTIVVVTDLQERGWDAGGHASVPESATIEIADVGAAPDDLALVALRPAGHQVIATIRNTGAAPREARVSMTLDGRDAGGRTVTVGPNAVADVTLPAAPGAVDVAVALDDPEGLQANNVRYAVLGGTDRTSLLVVTPSGDLEREAYYLKAAIEAAGAGAESYHGVGVSGSELATWSEDRVAAHAAVAVLSTRGLERRGRELLAAYARNGGGLLIAAGPDVDGEIVADVLGADTTLEIAAAEGGRSTGRTLAPVDARHPVFQAFGANAATLGLVKFRQVARVSGAGCHLLARFTSGEPALLDCTAGDGRALVFASDLNNRWNDFPLHATFLPFLHEAVRYLSGGRTHAGEYFVGEGAGAGMQKPGIVTLAAGPDAASGPRRRVAVNVDPGESDPARTAADEFQSAVTRLKAAAVAEAHLEARQQEDRQHVWQYVLAMMIAVLAVEGIVASRTA